MFTEKGNLTTHIRIHTGDKRYKCGFCDKSFVTLGNKNDHEVRHNKDRYTTELIFLGSLNVICAPLSTIGSMSSLSICIKSILLREMFYNKIVIKKIR